MTRPIDRLIEAFGNNQIVFYGPNPTTNLGTFKNILETIGELKRYSDFVIYNQGGRNIDNALAAAKSWRELCAMVENLYKDDNTANIIQPVERKVIEDAITKWWFDPGSRSMNLTAVQLVESLTDKVMIALSQDALEREKRRKNLGEHPGEIKP